MILTTKNQVDFLIIYSAQIVITIIIAIIIKKVVEVISLAFLIKIIITIIIIAITIILVVLVIHKMTNMQICMEPNFVLCSTPNKFSFRKLIKISYC